MTSSITERFCNSIIIFISYRGTNFTLIGLVTGLVAETSDQQQAGTSQNCWQGLALVSLLTGLQYFLSLIDQ